MLPGSSNRLFRKGLHDGSLGSLYAGKLSIQVDAPEFGRLVRAVVPFNGFDLLHVLVRDLKIKDFKVLLQPLFSGGLGDHHRVPLEAPSEDKLRRCLVVFLRQTLQFIIATKFVKLTHEQIG
jgi:hypothetical protein